MSIELQWIYIYGWLVVGGAMVEELTLRDILISYLAALGYPVSLPSQLLKRIMR